jgi:putative DNA primase/helicase
MNAGSNPQPYLHLVAPDEQGAGAETLPEVSVTKSLASIVEALSTLHEWAGVLGWNEFAQAMVFRKDPPFSDGSRAGDEVRETDITRMRVWFGQVKGVLVSKSVVTDAARLVALRDSFHPVREYLLSLSWDGIPRAGSWLEEFCGVRPSSSDHRRLVQAVARKWLISCVARALKPGCKVDAMLILEGKQGIGKSTALRTLAGDDFFCDSMIDFGTKDACQQVQGVWIYELSELTALLRSDTSSAKAFLTRTEDKFRVPYGRSPETIPRSVVFCGSTNQGTYLKDRTGNRRFWVIRCEESINVEGLRAVRDQLWAEARALFDSGEQWHLSPEEETLMSEQHEERLEVDPFEERVEVWVSKQGDRPIAMDHLLEMALGLSGASRNPQVTRRVVAALERLGYARKKLNANGTRAWRYVRTARPTVPVSHYEEVDAIHAAAE